MQYITVQMISFNNTEIAYSSQSTQELKRARLLFLSISYPWIVTFGKLMLKLATALRIPTAWAIKPTIFKQFVGGETIDECKKVVDTLSKFGVKSILDYSVESKDNEDDRESAFNEIMLSIKNASQNPAIAFAVFKPSGIADTYVLEKISNGIELSENEKIRFDHFSTRVDSLCKTAYDLGIPILIDAEDSWYQAALDDIIDQMMAKYNTEKTIVFNTLQMYRTDRLSFLRKIHNKAIDQGYTIGIKLVRGAYMEKERKRAAEKGYLSPIHETKSDTDRDFNAAVKYCIQNIDSISMFCGTHNEDSVLYTLMLMEQNGIAPNDSRIFFSQLLGMSDNITFNLAANGYNSSKYIPYGPVKEVMPYLIRRAQENTSVKGQTGRELTLIRNELARRAKSGSNN